MEIENTVSFEIKKLNDFAVAELYEMMVLRSRIFVVEQNCAYQDLDGKDDKALHLLMKEKEAIIGYARLFDAGDCFEEASIGRVVIDPKARRGGLGTVLVKQAIEASQQYFNPSTIRISAQKHLIEFYGACGFVAFGKEYLEDGIPHMAMRWSTLKEI